MRYIVERSLPAGLPFSGWPIADMCLAIAEINDVVGVTWLHSYVRDDQSWMVCLYEADSPEAIRRAAERNGLPVDRISRVTTLDPNAIAPARIGRG